MNRKLAEQLRAGRHPSAETVRARARELTYYQPHTGALRTVSYGALERPSARVEKLTYETEPGISIPALLFVPPGGPARKRAVILSDSRGKAAAAADAEKLAEKGNIVLVPDLRGFGETEPPLDRRDYFFRNFGDYESALTALLVGKTLVGMRAADVTAGVDLLAARADVDPARIAAVGRADAALPTLFAALFDRRINRVVLDQMLVSYQSVVDERLNQNIPAEIVPSALKYFDIPDVVSALSPRQVAIFNGINPLGQELTAAKLKEAYAGVATPVEVAVRDRQEQEFAPLERFLDAR